MAELGESTMKYAIVKGSRGRGEVEALLPGNYDVVGVVDPDEGLPIGEQRAYSQLVFIAGEDVAGWTLDEYVIPRLASGNLVAVELTEEAK